MNINEFNIRPIKKSDIYTILDWKNRYRKYFFHSDIISVKQQNVWFEDYLLNDNNTIYIIEDDTSLIGCIGVYDYDDKIEIYNVILGNDKYKSSGLMTRLLFYIFDKYNKNVLVKVLNINPSMGWYKKNNFKLTEKNDLYSLLHLVK